MSKFLRCVTFTLIAALAGGPQAAYPQDEGNQTTFHVKVEMVVLSFTVTDQKGHYVNGLKPRDFRVFEDDIPEKIATFAEGNRAPVQVLPDGSTRPLPPAMAHRSGEMGNPNAVDLSPDVMGANIFILFDTSNYMYRGFVYASDAIADFIRGLDRADSVAVYTYSRNLNRAVTLNRDRTNAISGLRDASRVAGRKVVIVFSNGPDNASMVAPDDVRAVAEDEGIPIYVISTSEVNKDPVSAATFKRISTNTGGKSYFAKTWQKQVEAFESIREDLGNSYTVTYYPQPNPNEGFRRIRVDITSEAAKKYKIRARPGYRPQRGL